MTNASAASERRRGDPLAFEMSLWAKGYVAVAGIDEVGRGALLASVVAAAVILPPGTFIDGVRDSKALSPKRREELYERITRTAVAIGVGEVDARTIDCINIRQASRLAMRLAVSKLGTVPDYLLVDAEEVGVPVPQTAIIHGDALSHSIAAASIIAKVTRDRMCDEWDAQYPQYRIKSHKGYCTREHVAAILEHGPCALHRKTFLRNILQSQSSFALELGL